MSVSEFDLKRVEGPNRRFLQISTKGRLSQFHYWNEIVKFNANEFLRNKNGFFSTVRESLALMTV